MPANKDLKSMTNDVPFSFGYYYYRGILRKRDGVLGALEQRFVSSPRTSHVFITNDVENSESVGDSPVG